MKLLHIIASEVSGSFAAGLLGLVQAIDRNLCGTRQSSDGTIFKITPSGTLTALFTFNRNDGGESPAAGLIQGTDGSEADTVHVNDSGEILCTAKTAACLYHAVPLTPK